MTKSIPPTDTLTVTDELASLMDGAAPDGWERIRIDNVPVERASTRRAYFSDDGTPEDDPWFVIRPSVRSVNKGCTPPFESVALRSGSIGCMRHAPETVLRLIVNGLPAQLEGRLNSTQAIAAVNSTSFVDSADDGTPVVASAGLPNGVSDHGEFVRVLGTARSVSAALVGTDLATIEYRHADGSTAEVTVASDSDDAFEFLRLDLAGGWSFDPLTSVEGYVGHHQVLSDHLMVWFDGDALIQVRTTGSQGAAIIDRLAASIDPA